MKNFKKTSDAVKILNRVRAPQSGQRVYTTEDFIDLGDRHNIEKALSCLVEQNILRRIGRDLYDYPRISKILQRPAPPNISAAIDAIARRDNILILPDGIVAAHNLGLTNAVPARHSYLTDGSTQTLQIGGQTLKLRHADRWLMAWHNRAGAPVVLALAWLGENIAQDPDVVDLLSDHLSPDTKQDLMDGIKLMPDWMKPIVQQAAGQFFRSEKSRLS